MTPQDIQFRHQILDKHTRDLPIRDALDRCSMFGMSSAQGREIIESNPEYLSPEFQRLQAGLRSYLRMPPLYARQPAPEPPAEPEQEQPMETEPEPAPQPEEEPNPEGDVLEQMEREAAAAPTDPIAERSNALVARLTALRK